MLGKRMSVSVVASIALLAACFDKSVEAPGVELSIDQRIGGSKGIFDPAITVDPVTGRSWISYSTVDPAEHHTWLGNEVAVATHVAYSDDAGLSWHDIGRTVTAAYSFDASLRWPAKTHGTWMSEVSRIVYDPGSLPSERWKLISLRYPEVGSARRFEFAWFTYKVAAAPEQLPDATERKLLAGSLTDPDLLRFEDEIKAPAFGQPLLNVANFGLDCVPSEPTMYATTTALYLGFACVNIESGVGSIELLSCAAPCNSTTWQYRGALLDRDASVRLGGDLGYSAPDLFSHNNAVLLSVTPQRSSPFAGFYDGCDIFAVPNLDMPTTSGLPLLHVEGKPGSFHGACTYHDATPSLGILYGQLAPNNVEMFHTFASGVTPP
jgi:hypothetical protein